MARSNKTLRIGCGAGFADDRIDPALDLVEQGELDVLVFECLAERTIARANLTRQKSPERGYSPRLVKRLGAPGDADHLDQR
jgi:Acyclic terpene utilisation family protein AtuA